MRIDIHTHISPNRIAAPVLEGMTATFGYPAVGTNTVDGIKAHMRASGVDKSVVLGVVERLARESQGVIMAWNKVEAPPEMDAAHRFAGDAMRLTQDGFIELGTYFTTIVKNGIAFDDELKAGTSRLEAASVLWSQARAAAEPAN